MADTASKALEKVMSSNNLAKERLLWAIKPFGALGLVLWVLSPGISDRADVQGMALAGFLMGALYGLFLYGKELRYHLVQRVAAGREQKNRVPEEFYWGHIDKEMARWG